MTGWNRHHTAGHRIRAVGRRRHTRFAADRHGGMHLAVHGRFGSLGPPVCHHLVSHRVIPAGVRRQLPADGAGGHLDQAVIGGIAVQDVLLVQALMNLVHIGLPQRCGSTGTGGLGGQRLIVVMTDPQGGCVISGHAGEEYALLVGVGTCFSAHNLPADLRAGTGAALHRGLQHIHNQPGRAGREHLTPVLMLMSVPDHMTGGIGNAQYGDRFLVHAAVGQCAEGHRHLQRSNTGGAQAQAEGRGIDMPVINAHPVQEVHAAFHAHHGHQGCCRGCVMGFCHGRPQGFGAYIAAAPVVLRPGIIALGIFPSGNGYWHVVYHGRGTGAQLQGRRVNRDRLDGGTDRHLHVRRPVQGLPCRHLISGTDNRFQLTRPVIQHRAGSLRLNGFGIGAVGILCPEHLV